MISMFVGVIWGTFLLVSMGINFWNFVYILKASKLSEDEGWGAEERIGLIGRGRDGESGYAVDNRDEAESDESNHKLVAGDNRNVT